MSHPLTSPPSGGFRGPTLAADGLLLRPLGHADADALWRVGQVADVGRYTSIAWPFTRAAAELLIAEAEAGWRAGTAARFGVFALPEGALAGMVGLLHLYPEAGDAEVAYWLGAAARGRGLARRAVALLCDWAFAALGLKQLHLMIDLDNAPSHAVARACGFRPVGEVFWSHPTDRSKDGSCTRYERRRPDVRSG